MPHAIVGAGALGRIVANILGDDADVEFYDDDPSTHGETVLGYPVRGSVEQIIVEHQPELDPIVAVGDVEIRQELYETLVEQGYTHGTAIHPSSSVAPSADIGDGVIIKDNATIEPGVTVGDNAIVGNNTAICHDTNIGSHARLAPGVTIAGHSTIGEASYLSVDSSVDRCISVGDRVVIASGCTIWEDVPSDSIVKLPERMDVETR